MNLNNITSSIMPEPTNAKNVLASDVSVKGTVEFSNELFFDGKIEGEIVSDGVLTIGKNARVTGEIRTKSVTVLGTVDGNIAVTEKCELKASSQLTGDLKAMRIMIEEGATFIGKSEVTPNKSGARQGSSSGGSAAAPTASSSSGSSAPGLDPSRKNQPAGTGS